MESLGWWFKSLKKRTKLIDVWYLRRLYTHTLAIASGLQGARRIWRKRSFFLDPFRRRHHDAEHAANVEITRKTVTRSHSARAIANTYFRFWVRINVSRSRRHALSSISWLALQFFTRVWQTWSGPMLSPQRWRSACRCQLCGGKNKFPFAFCGIVSNLSDT